MRKTVHLCLSSHDEVMYRSEADLIMGFNCYAVAVLSTESRALADGFLSTHNHTLIQSDHPRETMFRSRNAYSRYFNTRYRRKGRLGEKHYFQLDIEGLYHMMAAINYVNRQGLHHGLAATPFDYPHSSANVAFRKQLGKCVPPTLLPDSLRYRFLPSNVTVPSCYRMNVSGLLLREDILDSAYIEELYISPRSYLYQMNRLGEDDHVIKAQKEENDTPPVTLEVIESGVPDFDPGFCKTNEFGKVNNSRITDIELCQWVDTTLVPHILKNPDKKTIYDISRSRRIQLYERITQEQQQRRFQKMAPLFNGKFATDAQLQRCLCLQYPK